MTGLLDAVNENSNIVVIISDNDSVSMTGGQESSASGKIESICKGIGVDPDHIHTIVPHKKNHEEMKSMIRKEIDFTGVSVIIPSRQCIQKALRDKRKQRKITKTNCQS